MTDWLFGRPGTRTIRARTLANNTASRRVLEKHGFSLTGYDPDGQAVYQRKVSQWSFVSGSACGHRP
jgi:RimJ/RimL family protein N-acetyltransferase